MQEFDYVVVGGGSAGCVVASRLSEDASVSVCLLEAGGDGKDALIRAPFGFAFAVPRGINSWHYETVPQPGFHGRRGFQPRGKALGGSSTLNAMIYARGPAWDYDHWAELGNPGWSYADVLPYFKRMEHAKGGEEGWRGTSGPLHVQRGRRHNPLYDAFIQAGREAGIARITSAVWDLVGA